MGGSHQKHCARPSRSVNSGSGLGRHQARSSQVRLRPQRRIKIMPARKYRSIAAALCGAAFVALVSAATVAEQRTSQPERSTPSLQSPTSPTVPQSRATDLTQQIKVHVPQTSKFKTVEAPMGTKKKKTTQKEKQCKSYCKDKCDYLGDETSAYYWNCWKFCMEVCT